jgi:hypothetical protein
MSEESPRPPRVSEAVARLKDAFSQNPDTELSADDASRVVGLEPSECRAVLEALQDAHFVECGRDGRFRRRTD